MSEENVEVVRRYVDAWNQDELEGMLEVLSEDWRFETAQLFSDTDAVYEGHDGFLKFRDTFAAAWSSIKVKVEDIQDLGDRVLVLFTFQGKGRGSGVDVSVPYANLLTLRDGKVTQTVGFSSWAEALEAAGLSE